MKVKQLSRELAIRKIMKNMETNWEDSNTVMICDERMTIELHRNGKIKFEACADFSEWIESGLFFALDFQPAELMSPDITIEQLSSELVDALKDRLTTALAEMDAANKEDE